MPLKSLNCWITQQSILTCSCTLMFLAHVGWLMAITIVRDCSFAEPMVVLLLPGATESCKIAGRFLSTVRLQPGRWEDDGMQLCYRGKTLHVLEYSDFLDFKTSRKASRPACSVLETQVTLCLGGAETATQSLSNVSVWKYNVSVKSRNTSDLWPVGIMYLKATKPGSVCGCKLFTLSSSACHWIPGLGLTSATPQ